MKVISRSELSAKLDAMPPEVLGQAVQQMSPKLRANKKFARLLRDYQGWVHGRVSREQVENSLAWAMGFTAIDENKI